MPWSERALVAVILVATGWSASCSRCGEEPVSTELPGSEPLVFEQIELGITQDRFGGALAGMVGLSIEEAKRLVQCGEQTTLMVIDPAEESIDERAPGGHRLTNCALLQAGAGRSSDVVSVRGEFIDDALASTTISFSGTAHRRLITELSARYGEPAEETLEEHSILGTEARQYQLWRTRDAIWALSHGRLNTELLHQSRSRCQELPRLPEPKKRPPPVDLSEIGLGGGLDLKAPLPQIDAGLLIGGDR